MAEVRPKLFLGTAGKAPPLGVSHVLSVGAGAWKALELDEKQLKRLRHKIWGVLMGFIKGLRLKTCKALTLVRRGEVSVKASDCLKAKYIRAEEQEVHGSCRIKHVKQNKAAHSN